MSTPFTVDDRALCAIATQSGAALTVGVLYHVRGLTMSAHGVQTLHLTGQSVGWQAVRFVRVPGPVVRVWPGEGV